MRTLSTGKINIEAKLVFPNDVAVTSNGDIVVIDTSRYVKFFDENGNYTGFSSTLIDKVEPRTGIKTKCVATSSAGKHLVGDINRRMITIHEKQTGGKDLVSSSGKISLTIMPRYLAVSKNQQVIVSDWESKKAVSMTMSGQQLFTINTWKVNGKSDAKPYGLTFDPEGNIYIVVRRSNDSHIHQYTNKGEFVKCIAQKLYHPNGLAWYKDALYVANQRSVLIYKQE